ncbi:MAG: alpha-1,2-fucosyltransferase [Lachnospiraceae bacterium]|nr:alpha-1,2-fucosyltransferase [Lachnospiraceae bacterium]
MGIKIQFLNGGLANQAFQYIFSRYYELSHPGEKMYLDDSYFANNTVHNGYELNKVFGLKPSMASELFNKEAWDNILAQRKEGRSLPQILQDNGVTTVMIAEADNYKQWNPFAGTVCSIPCNQYIPQIMDQDINGILYYHGYWINGKYFEKYAEEIRKDFTFPELTDEKNLSYLGRIQSENSVCVHIRRGDFVSLGWAYDSDTYKALVDVFIENFGKSWTAFVFSDDIEWCKKNQRELGLESFEEAVFVEGNINGKNYIDLQLMSSCKGMIVSNSSFSYLAALLNKNRDFFVNSSSREILG